MAFWISVAAIFILLVFSGFFSGSETALTAVSKARMHSLETKGNKRAGLVNKLREKKDRLLGALLLGNNLVNILATSISTSVLVKIFGDAGVAYATLAMTLLVLIFAEVLPKTYALNNADRVALSISPIIKVLVAVLSPITDAIAKVVRVTFKLFGVDIVNVAIGSDSEELRGAIELHRGKEEETQEERAMLRSILDLADVEVDEIMVHRRDVETIDSEIPASKIVDIVLESPYTRLPVWKDKPDNIIGILHAKLLLKELRKCDNDISKLDIHAAMRNPWFIPESTTLFDQLQEFRKRQEHLALMVDEYGSLIGLVTLEDILEEIVGEIDDEHDVSVPGLKPQEDGTCIVDGKVTIRDLNREFEWGLPDEEYSTIGGLLLFETQRIPDAGQKFSFFGFQFEILRRQKNQITSVRIYPPINKKDTVG